MPLQPRHLIRALALALASLALIGCALRDDRPLARCLVGIQPESLNIQDFPRPAGTIAQSSSVQHRDVFDAEHEMLLQVDDPSTTLAVLCDRLQDQLAAACDTRRVSTGSTHCAFAVSSHYRATTGEDGIHHHRRMEGRVHLLAETSGDGHTKLLLTASEWPG